jgi:hypothetical protein
VQLPAELVDSRRGLWIRGKVVRIDEESDGPGGRHVLGILFENPKPSHARALAVAVKAHAAGPMVLADAVAAPPSRNGAGGIAPARSGNGAVAPAIAPAVESVLPASRSRTLRDLAAPTSIPLPPPDSGPTPLAAPGLPEDRRKQKRAHYDGEVVHLDGEAQSVLVGRDISPTGMRVEPNPRLQQGASLRLAVYASGREQPFMVRARVLRNDGPDGVAIAFESPSAAVAERIERMVASLPDVEPLQGGERDALGAVVGEVLESEAPALEPAHAIADKPHP